MGHPVYYLGRDAPRPVGEVDLPPLHLLLFAQRSPEERVGLLLSRELLVESSRFIFALLLFRVTDPGASSGVQIQMHFVGV